MSTILTGVILIAGTIGFVLLLVFINKRNKKREDKALINAVNEAGVEKGYSFSSQELLKDKIIGLDGVNQRLLIFDSKNTNHVTNIQLADVKECSLKKEYESINYGNDKKADMEQQLRTIAIRFSFKNRSGFFSLSFYDSMLHSVYEMAELEAKAKHWEMLLSKLILKDARATI
jgi:hypothetical protein